MLHNNSPLPLMRPPLSACGRSGIQMKSRSREGSASKIVYVRRDSVCVCGSNTCWTLLHQAPASTRGGPAISGSTTVSSRPAVRADGPAARMIASAMADRDTSLLMSFIAVLPSASMTQVASMNQVLQRPKCFNDAPTLPDRAHSILRRGRQDRKAVGALPPARRVERDDGDRRARGRQRNAVVRDPVEPQRALAAAVAVLHRRAREQRVHHREALGPIIVQDPDIEAIVA